ncbi:DUF1326 domain-containing protein [Desulforhopalus singaporensis]|uniref:DUF1326 domain-containing protein n=1 Tax=Desulforhopalus singaporensis TaxID=91360 RepID=A0A1H0TDV8_9BACT|nr:DUF1326 domain-containing protein [Desulforhopalus singaporensis]SDP51778.1 Protein of unknown function [Desulforhopalus singaporensis]
MHTNKPALAKSFAVLVSVIFLMVPGLSLGTDEPDWHFNGTVIEACSCPMFCPCYFNTEPALNHTKHGAKHFCKFNMAYKVNKGHYGDTDLAGVKFWVAGDLGDSWEDGETEWAIVTFQPGTTEAQKNGVTTALSNIFPVKWKSFEVAEDAPIEWMASEERAEATLGGGANGHIILNKWQGLDGESGMLSNIAYFGAPRNSGFKMMPNEIETWKVGDKAFEFKGTTGFMITVDMSAKDLAM